MMERRRGREGGGGAYLYMCMRGVEAGNIGDGLPMQGGGRGGGGVWSGRGLQRWDAGTDRVDGLFGKGVRDQQRQRTTHTGKEGQGMGGWGGAKGVGQRSGGAEVGGCTTLAKWGGGGGGDIRGAVVAKGA